MYVFIGGCICGFCVIRALSGWVLCSMMGVRFFVLFGWLCMCLALGASSGNLTVRLVASNVALGAVGLSG